MSKNPSIISCHGCGLLQKISHMPEDGEVKCCRCDAPLRKRERVKASKSIEHTLAMVIAALVLFAISNIFPIIEVKAEGHEMQSTLYGCVHYLLSHDMHFLGGLVLLTTIAAPLIQLVGLLYVLLPIHFKRVAPYATQVYAIVRKITSWSMLEVLMLGIIVSVVKLSAMATVIPSIALWTFVVLIFFIAAILNDLDNEILWEQLSPTQDQVGIKNNLTADSEKYLRNCHNCNLLSKVVAHESTCSRCQSPVHLRKPNSINRSLALLIAALVMYVPANIMPVMVITSFGEVEGDTIVSGVIYLATHGDLALGMILFIASVFVPSIKLLILTFLIVSTKLKSQWRLKERTSLYRLTEFIGRWSMVDIFVATLMATLIQIEGLAVIEVGFGAVAFGSVVVLTMFSAMAFDPRLMWDHLETDKIESDKKEENKLISNKLLVE